MIIAAIIFNTAEVILLIITPFLFPDPDGVQEWVETGDEVTMGLVIMVVYAVVLFNIMRPLKVF